MAASDGPLNGANLEFVESLFAAYSADPTSVDAEWRAYFDSQAGASASGDVRLGPG
jgi:2-oxoglutarate dehydrogenase E1 component